METWDIYDRWGTYTGRQVTKGKALAEGEYHLAAELWLVDTQSRILVQQRSERCEILPGVWGLTVRPKELMLMDRIVRTDDTHLIWDIYMARCDKTESFFCLQKEEVSQVKWLTREAFMGFLEQGMIYRYPEIEEILSRVLREADKG